MRACRCSHPHIAGRWCASCGDECFRIRASRDDYPLLGLAHQAFPPDLRTDYEQQAVDALAEIDRLREWKLDASAALDQYEDLRARIETAMEKALEIR